MNHDDAVLNLMTVCAGLRAELADAQFHATTFADSLANALQTCADLRAERDALLAQSTLIRDATDPGPTLIRETRHTFPLNALRNHKWKPVV